MRACLSKLGGRGRGRGRSGCGGRWGVLGGAVLALAAASVLRVPGGERRERVHLEGVPAARLAHLLADFTAHPPAGGEGGWRVRDDRGDPSRWTYRVTFACGARCAGEARVLALVHPATAVAVATHTVHTTVTLCTRLPLPLVSRYLSYCDELEVESAVSATAAGCLLDERARARCCALHVLTGACSRLLDAHRTTRTLTLARLAPAPAPAAAAALHDT